METKVYAVNSNHPRSPVYHKLESVEKVISEGSNTKIIFSTGEIELSVYSDELRISSKKYLPNGGYSVTRDIVKKLIPSYDSQKALANAKMSILRRVVNLEMRLIEEENARQLRTTFKLERGHINKPNHSKAHFNFAGEDILLAVEA
jgi:hypothetical protein